MGKFIFNIVIILFSVVFIIGTIISRKKGIKSIEKQKGEILYITRINKWQIFLYVILGIYIPLIVMDMIREPYNTSLTSIVIFNIIIYTNSVYKKTIITPKGIGLQGSSNRLTTFATWDTINDIHWKKYNSNILHVEYQYLDTVKEFELKFSKDEIGNINCILERYACFK